MIFQKLSPAEVLKIVIESSEEAEDHNFEARCYDCEVRLPLPSLKYFLREKNINS